MKRSIYSLVLVIFAMAFSQSVLGQNVAITDDASYTANSSAMLDVKSLTKGFLAPRMTSTQRAAIATPAQGLLVFDTTYGRYYVYNGTQWVDLSSGSATGPFWSYNSPNVYLTTSTNYLGLGTSSPQHKLHLLQSVGNLTGTDGAYIDIQNSYNGFGTTAGIRLTNGTSGSPNVFKGGIFYRDTLTWNRGDLIFANKNSADAVNVSIDDARLIIRNSGAVEVKGSSQIASGKAIFHVQNANGDTVFAVYPEGVRVYVDDNAAKATGSRGGFAVGGFSGAKTLTHEYLRVTPDSVRVYINDDYNPPKSSGSRGGFAVGGFSGAKGLTSNYLFVQDDSSRVYVADSLEGFGVENIEGSRTRIMRLSTDNYFIGHESGVNNVAGKYNSFLGYRTGEENSSGDENVFIGYKAGMSNITGDKNVYVGFEAGLNCTSSDNVFIGHEAGHDVTTGNYNLFVGTRTGWRNSTGSANTFIGNLAGSANYTGQYNTCLGFFAGNATNGDNNTIIGSMAGWFNNAGTDNVYLGAYAGAGNTSGNSNIAIGVNAGNGNSTGIGNVYLGYNAGYSATGSNKLYIENTSSNSPLIYGEFNNDIVGINGSLGVGTMAPAQKLHVENSTGDVTAKIRSMNAGNAQLELFEASDYGFKFDYDGAVDALYLWSKKFTGNDAIRMTWQKDGFIGIGTTAPNTKLDISGGARIQGANWPTTGAGMELAYSGGSAYIQSYNRSGAAWTSLRLGGNVYPVQDNSFALGASTLRWTAVWATDGTINTSDERLKENISDINYGLQQVMMLTPVSYNWKNGNKEDVKLGLVAQDVEKVIKEVVVIGEDEDHTRGLNYSELIPVLIKAIQEQQQQIEELKKVIQEQGK